MPVVGRTSQREKDGTFRQRAGIDAIGLDRRFRQRSHNLPAEDFGNPVKRQFHEDAPR
jgi:hypothetical protein